MSEYEVGKWYGWNGGKSPVHPETVVEYVWHGPSRIRLEKFTAGSLLWGCSDNGYFLSAFRIITPYVEPKVAREIVLYEDECGNLQTWYCSDEKFYTKSKWKEVLE